MGITCCLSRESKAWKLKSLNFGMQAFFSGTVRVWNELYSADANLERVIARRDSRWRHVGISVRRPRLADLRRAFWQASHGTVLDYI